MEMCVISSPNLKQIVMLFNKNTLDMNDDDLLVDLPKWLRKSVSYDVFKRQKDLSVKRVTLNGLKTAAAIQAGDLLYSYLSDGYTCLGNFVGNPKPDMSHYGVHTVHRDKGVGFYI
ncbi:hypothetical protein AB6E79_11505 [Vibrio lentus]